MTKEFNNLEELEPYYDKKTNTYIFEEDGEPFNIQLSFNLFVNANIYACNIDACNIGTGDIYACNIHACNIYARNIHACNIHACNIDAWDIKAEDINYFAVCVSYNNIICKSIKGRRNNCIHKALDGNVIIKEKGEK